MLKRSFFQRETVKTAVDLLGCVLTRVTEEGTRLRGRVVETEAYLGLKDDSCHSFGDKKTGRTQVMYLAGGVTYIYFTYGMHHCFNIVTAGEGQPEAVLIRAVQPLAGIEEMKKNRSWDGHKNMVGLTNGPGKLCQAFDICKKLNGKSLQSQTLYMEKGFKILPTNIVSTARVGLSPVRNSCYWPLRFYIKDNSFVSL